MKSPIAKDLRTPKYKMRVVRSKKKKEKEKDDKQIRYDDTDRTTSDGD